MTESLRIAVFAHEFPALTETFVLNQVTGLLDLGHDVTIFAERPRSDGVEHEDVHIYGLRERTRYLNLPRNKITRMAKALRQLARSRKIGLLKLLNFVRYGRDAVSCRLLFWSFCVGDDRDFDVIHCHFGPVGRIALALRDNGAINGRLVTVFHGVDVSAALRRNPEIYGNLFRRGDLFLPISDHWRQKLIEYGCPPGRTAVHHMGVRIPRRMHPERSFSSDRQLTVIATVGRMVEKKGIEFALRAISEILHRGYPVRYEIVGSGPLHTELEGLCRRLGIRDHVRFHGWQPGDIVSTLVEASDILLAPSVTDRNGDQEGIPVVLMEAMALGIPVISSFHSGIPELVEDGVSGILVAERDWPGIADAIIHMIVDPSAYAAMGRAARRKIESSFNIDTLNIELEQRFLELVPERAGGGQTVTSPQPYRPHLTSGVRA